MKVDYSLYLVTDSSLVPKDTTLLAQIERALQGGTTIVQLREKELETGPFIALGLQVKALTNRYHVPLIINDRLDVAQAIDADGVHIGQDDMPLVQARKILGPTKIIGVSVYNQQEANDAIENGADYLGIGAVWDTSTKKIKRPPLGIKGVQDVLRLMNVPIPTVAIGGIHVSNAQELMMGSASGTRHLDGLAIVSAIIGSSDPKQTCLAFSGLLTNVFSSFVPPGVLDTSAVVNGSVKLVELLRQTGPMVHHITNYVVINDNANATLALGASPIMSTNPEEFEDLAKVNGALLLNMGTLNDIDAMVLAAQTNARHGHPVVLDPVGAGATQFRKDTVARFLKECRLSVIKGNGGEILSMANRGGRSRGVDSVGNNGGEANAVLAVAELAKKNDCVVVMTGPMDYISDGTRVFVVDNGHPMMGLITGSGCMASSVVACFQAVTEDPLIGAVAGMLTITIASELAMKRPDVKGPGTFRTALLDELYTISKSPEIIRTHARLREIPLDPSK
ncbi:Hydroxyethylthiazole kinase family-domain-containing protein [Phycomyces nitens]|nr:Hydroxyethylthiazole kinase family-domain-containing protein [Phycomyces nitens]